MPALLGAWQAGFVVELPRAQGPRPEGVLVLHDEDGAPGIDVRAARAEVASHTPSSLRRLRADERLVSVPALGLHRTAEQLLGEVDALAKAFAAMPLTFLSTVSPFDLHGLLFGVLLPLLRCGLPSGAVAISPDDVAASLATHDGSFLVATPEHLRLFVEATMPRGISVISCGAPLPPDLQLELVFRHRWTVHDVFGSPATGSVATRTSPLSHWKPLPGVTVRADADGQMVTASPWAPETRLLDRIRVDEDGTFEHVPTPTSYEDAGNARFEIEETATPHEFRMVVPRDCVFFRGHFEQLALLPAVVQLSRIAMPLVRRSWDDLGSLQRLRRARFRRPIFPGQELLVKLTRTDQKVRFDILVGGAAAASGTFEFEVGTKR